jgi:uncharacterized membrane protein YbaN (DUF454 family)
VSDPIEPVQQVYGLKRALYLLGGSVAMLLAAVGCVLPGIPATPFIILAVALFARSSPWMHGCLLRSRVFGPYIHDWRTHGAIRPHVRVVAVIAVLIGVGLTCFLSPVGVLLKALTIVAGLIGLVVVFRLPVRNMPRGGAQRSVFSQTETVLKSSERRIKSVE